MVDYDYQRREVERMVRQVRGVVGVTDLITVKPPVSPEKVQQVIEDAFRREAEVDARHIRVEVSDHTARLYGTSTRCTRQARPGPQPPPLPESPPWKATLGEPWV
jgi:osmotically-inducible protein OsmY